MASPVRVLFVCLGNICRTPTAHGLFRQQLEQAGLSGQVEVDSAGTGHWHLGKAPDPRTTAAARARGVDLGDLRARQVTAEDFHRFDYVLAMDRSNLLDLQSLAPEGHKAHLGLFLDFASLGDVSEVPDPYYGGDQGFEQVLDLVEDAGLGLLAHLRQQHGL